MIDVTRCVNEECMMKLKCYRYRIKPDKYDQAYTSFSPENNSRYKFKCEGYIKNNEK